MYKRIVIDRIENDTAICERETENGKLEKINIPLSSINGEIKEGAELVLENGNYKAVRSESKETEMKKRLGALFERSKKQK